MRIVVDDNRRVIHIYDCPMPVVGIPTIEAAPGLWMVILYGEYVTVPFVVRLSKKYLRVEKSLEEESAMRSPP